MTFPLEPNKQIMFQIFDKHEFGYNPEELEEVLRGILVFDQISAGKGVWDIKNNMKERVGFLEAKVEQKFFNKNEQVPDVPETDEYNLQHPDQVRTIAIKSIILKLINKSLKRGIVELQIDRKKVRSSQLKHKSGQLACLEFDSMNFEEVNKNGTMKLISFENGREEIIGTAILDLSGSRSFQRIKLMKQDMQIGFILIESSIIDRTNKNISLIVSNTSSISYQTPYVKQFVNSQILRIKSRTAFTQQPKDHLGSSRFSKISDRYSISNPSKKFRKQSIISNNGNIIFSKEKRFTNYEDKPNPRISYLNKNDMQFRSPSSGKFYRGAGFGFGSKIDFTQEGKRNPGVGNYKLPSIWDRY